LRGRIFSSILLTDAQVFSIASIEKSGKTAMLMSAGMEIAKSMPAHPNLNRVLHYDIGGSPQGTIVMEYCDSGDMRQLLDERRNLSECEANCFARQFGEPPLGRSTC
jgi:serine/threonine protein kinase